MKKIFAIAGLLATMMAHAQANPVVGTFGHDYTEKTNEPVWTVSSAGQQIKLKSHGGGPTVKVTILSREQRKALWDALAFDSDTGSFAQAECVGGGAEYICHVPMAARAGIPELKTQKSDFFHYDRAGGLMEIRKIAAAKK